MSIIPMHRRLLKAVLCIIYLFSGTATFGQESRVALVIGNAQYEYLPSLKNPTNDATAISDVLANLGFTVYLANNTTQAELANSIDFFSTKSKHADVVLVYYAGHSATFKDENLIFPIDFQSNPLTPTQSLITLEGMIDKLTNTAGLNIVLFDACSEPVQISDGENLIELSLLAPTIPPLNTILSYAATIGAAAYDGAAKHSLFTGALLDHLQQPDVDIETMLRTVRREVIMNSQGVQIPQTYSALVSGFHLNPTRPQNLLQSIQTNQSLQNKGYSEKPVLQDINLGLHAPTDISKPDLKRKKMIQLLCSKLSKPLPAACKTID